ncbi:MAG: tRNA modification GTPase MnmE [Nitrospirales bacterium]|nr:MAG: tRNA modification GTPase MnmE [Nitrospirales bacterium]
MQLDDTICAVATPIGEGGIGIVRVSGPDALAVTSNILFLRRGKSLETVRSHQLYLADVKVSSQETEQNLSISKVDEALVVLMRSPRSYTGEDVVEIHCHGGSLILTTVCEALVRYGARLAEPGEFTRRAFLHGRLDLTQAEAVLDTIRATTASSLQVAQEQLQGSLAEKIDRMRDELIHVLAHLEAGLDFVEEDITFLGQDELKRVLQSLETEISSLLKTAEEGRIIREGVITAIVGRPNVGKSSLLNTLLETNRAIVSAIPGTTRDVLEEVMSIHGILIRLQDTAGIREAGDSLEEEGIRRSTEALEQAELLLLVLDGSQALSEEDALLIRNSVQKKRVIVLNKSDLPGKVRERDIHVMLCESSDDPQEAHRTKVVSVSAKTRSGFEQLCFAIRDVLITGQLESRDAVMITRLRHKQALLSALESITNALLAIEQEFSADCVAVDVRASLNFLGEITGSVSTDDILDRVFSEFCIGK